MIKAKRIRALLNGEFRTFAGFILVLAAFFAWLDYRDVTHDEISVSECESLNSKWLKVHRQELKFSASFDVGVFKCPTGLSGLVRGLSFLQETDFLIPSDEPPFDFWSFLTDVSPVLGDESGLRFMGKATYAGNRIDINPEILERGDPVEIAGILIHEARHLQQGRNTHVTCVRDRRLTCDSRLAENLLDGDAYSYSVLFFDGVLRDSNASAQDKRSAAILLDEVLKNRFNAVRPSLLERYQP